jgi:hypothetical protein
MIGDGFQEFRTGALEGEGEVVIAGLQGNILSTRRRASQRFPITAGRAWRLGLGSTGDVYEHMCMAYYLEALYW